MEQIPIEHAFVWSRAEDGKAERQNTESTEKAQREGRGQLAVGSLQLAVRRRGRRTEDEV